MPTASVVVTSYRRPAALLDCLAGLDAQDREPDEIVIVLHAADLVTAGTLADRPGLRIVTVGASGSVAALNAGLSAATGDVVAIVDDDAIPAPDWLERLLATFARDARIAGVGGRDIVHDAGRVLGREDQGVLGRFRGAPRVGRIQWFGRHVGNHHIGEGGARDVDVLKGANMAFRRQMVLAHGFDARLRGSGAQPHSELSVCLPLRRRGLRLVYDPAIVVHHHPAARPAGDDRHSLDGDAMFEWTYNEALQLLDHLSAPQRLAFATWGALVARGALPASSRLRASRRCAAPERLGGVHRCAGGARCGLADAPLGPARRRESANDHGRRDHLPAHADAWTLSGRADRPDATPDEVLVVVHASDDESAPFVDARTDARRVEVVAPGLVAALNRGLAAARGDIVAFVDDDAVPAPDWLERIAAAYRSDVTIAAVGGRDVIEENGRVRGRADEGIMVRTFGPPHVGRLQWFGRQLGGIASASAGGATSTCSRA